VPSRGKNGNSVSLCSHEMWLRKVQVRSAGLYDEKAFVELIAAYGEVVKAEVEFLTTSFSSPTGPIFTHVTRSLGLERLMKRTKQRASPLVDSLQSQPGRKGLALSAQNKTSTSKVRLHTRFFTFTKEACGSAPERNINHQPVTAIWGW